MTIRSKSRHVVATVAEIEQLGRKIVEVKGMEIGIFSVDGHFYAWRNVCPHAAAPVCEGTVCGTRLPSMVYEYIHGRDQEILRCPWHGWEFDLKTGIHLVEGGVKLRGYDLEVDGDHIYMLI
ncbi:Rieske 2Fe-2S domain-containing protein [Paenibacillus qinlingensis]|uniref:Nitrite reductase/ring-hydroxylating ferredoxin subunit n=1 Tax=Paenibacillus qinlingensis TaxID=1837343 RepID=A0ABU1P6G4_9BACL|nr:Rieske 2Fe-2S domain-containing protein [Paenibacillus qinlingensis]MDR6555355.1 nitrite reductase/ring-hydroxylating ferredoxin subunit [Paenibacillus qinlingensis]